MTLPVVLQRRLNAFKAEPCMSVLALDENGSHFSCQMKTVEVSYFVDITFPRNGHGRPWHGHGH
jgi:hypothetical protein